MMKIVGIVIIAISVFLSGFLYFIKIKKRPEELDFFIGLLSEYEAELKWNRSSISEILEKFNLEKFKKYLSSIKTLQVENDYLYAFFDGNEFFKEFHLENEEIKVLKNFFESTGALGFEAECELCKKTLSALKTFKEDADDKKKKLCPLIIKLSLLSGLLVVILLI